MTRVATFNVNQHSTLAHVEADLEARMADVDVVLCQETVNIDLAAFAACQPGWAAFQIRQGDNDGHANTGVLHRTSLGTPTDTACDPVGDAKDTRPRFLTAVQFNGREWYGSVHVFPARDSAEIPAELAAAGAWVATRKGPVVLGLDKNQATPDALEKATGLKWHGVGIDGFLTNLPIRGVSEFPKGFSDHPGVKAVVTLMTPKLTPTRRVLAALRKLAATNHHKWWRERASKIIARKAAPAPTPAPKPSLDHKVMLPGAIRKPIPQTSSDPNIIPTGAVFHVAVSNADSLFGLFSNDGGIESTGYIRLDGTVEQYRPLTVQCDAQFDGNGFTRADGKLYGFTSWESQGGVPNGAGEWTDAQLATIKRIIRFHHDQWGTPLRQTPAWNADGFGYHRLFSQWNHNGHSCPGDGRVAQWNRVIVPWLKAGAPL